MSKVISKGIDPHELGFVSFTRAARSEASSRAADLFKVEQSDLEKKGWFRTLHGVCYRCLGQEKGELLTGKKADKEWLEEELQQEMGTSFGSEEGDGLAEIIYSNATAADTALRLWGISRSRLIPLEKVWRDIAAVDDRVPGLSFCKDIAKRYQMAKEAGGRCDFTDLLCWFSGWQCSVDGAEKVEPRGECPCLPVWFFDEQQDTSALLDAVCHRLIASSKWVYVVGDPFQAIYGWAGADPKHFMAWPASKRDIMKKSFRCPSRILEIGEDILRQCSNYWDREIEPREKGGRIESMSVNDAVNQIDPTRSWLVLARTNYEAACLASKLKKYELPWRPTRGNGGWAAPVKSAALRTLTDLEKGNPIDGDQWRQVLKVLPVKDLLARGTKAKFESDDYKAAELHPWVMLDELSEVGATPKLIDMIRTGQWASLIEDGEMWARAAKQWGVDALEKLNVSVGTIHSAKGAEAKNVLLLTTITPQVARSCENQSGFDEERRVEYVAVTRARERLIIANDPRARLKMEIPA